MISSAFSTGLIDARLAEALIVPIPKVENPVSLKDFRPISLGNVLLKLVSKVLVRRIRPYLDSSLVHFKVAPSEIEALLITQLLLKK